MAVDYQLLKHLIASANETVDDEGHSQAVAYLKNELAREPENATLHFGLALAYEDQGEYASAIEHYNRIVELAAGDPESWRLRGNFLLACEEGEQALHDFQKIVDLASDSEEGYRLSGAACLSLDDSDRAFSFYQQALERNSDNVDTHYGLALIYQGREEFDQAIVHYDRMVELMPDNPTAWGLRGAFFFDRGDYEAALSDFEAACELQPDVSQRHCDVGDTYRMLGRRSDAIESYRMALDCDPDDWAAHNGMGLVYLNQEGFSHALRHFDRVIELRPDDPVGFRNRGSVSSAIGNHEAALADFARVIELASDSVDGYLLRAAEFQAMGHLHQANELCQLALQKDDNDADAHRLTADVYAEQQDFDHATDHYNRMVELAADSTEAWRIRGIFRLARGKFAEALDDFAKMSELAPESVDSAALCAFTYYEMGDLPKSLELYQRVVQQDPENADLHFGIASVYESQQKYKEAINHYGRASYLAPKDLDAQLGRSRAYFSLGDFKSAVAAADKALEIEEHSADVYLARGQANAALAEFEEALADCDRGIEIEESAEARAEVLVPLYSGRAQTYLSLDNCSKAQQDLARALTLDPADSFALTVRGLVFQQQGEFEAALADFDQVLLSSPDNAYAHYCRGSVLLSLEAFADATNAFNEAIEIDQSDVDSWTDKADALRLWAKNLGEPAKLRESLAAADRAIEIDPKNVVAFAIRGAALWPMKQYERAIESLDQALQLDPGYAWARLEKANILFQNDDMDQAFKEYVTLQTSEYEMPARVGQFAVLSKLGREGEAKVVLDDTTRGKKKSASVYLDRAYAFVDLGMWHEAISDYRRAAELADSDEARASAHNGIAWYQNDKLETDLAGCIEHAELAVKYASDGVSKGNNLDTLGWLLYKQGNLPDARRHLLEALKHSKWDMLIRRHLKLVEDAIGQAEDAN